MYSWIVGFCFPPFFSFFLVLSLFLLALSFLVSLRSCWCWWELSINFTRAHPHHGQHFLVIRWICMFTFRIRQRQTRNGRQQFNCILTLPFLADVDIRSTARQPATPTEGPFFQLSENILQPTRWENTLYFGLFLNSHSALLTTAFHHPRVDTGRPPCHLPPSTARGGRDTRALARGHDRAVAPAAPAPARPPAGARGRPAASPPPVLTPPHPPGHGGRSPLPR